MRTNLFLRLPISRHSGLERERERERIFAVIIRLDKTRVFEAYCNVRETRLRIYNRTSMARTRLEP